MWFKALRHMAKEAKLCVTSMTWEEAMANKRFGFGRMSRRELLRAAGAAGVGVAMLPAFTRTAHAAEATYFTWSGYDIPEMFPGYVKQRGAPPGTPLFGDT
ncbi:MAG: twin-arginine translocation signal domain-containing protein, partial [Alphaproteobacteria bacterium]